MNLLTVLLKSLLTDSSVQALAKKTGVSTAVLKKLIPLAIPLLIKFMTGNAQSQSGAQSLLSALGQHTSKKSLPEQIEEADIDDGEVKMRITVDERYKERIGEIESAVFTQLGIDADIRCAWFSEENR